MMNQEAERLGMLWRSHLHDCYRNRLDSQHTTTVRDLATAVATHLITDHPNYFHYCKQRSFSAGWHDQPAQPQPPFGGPSIGGR